MQFARCEVKYSGPHNPIRKVSAARTNLWGSFTVGNVGVGRFFISALENIISLDNKDPNVKIYYITVLNDFIIITM